MSTGAIGAVSAAAMVVRDRLNDQDRDIRDNERLAVKNRRQLQSLLLNGGILRALAATVADFQVGLAYPSQGGPAPGGAFAVLQPPLPRPPLADESLVLSGASWPPEANAYDAQGNLVDASAVLDGDLVATGMALTFPEVRARLLGMTSVSAPTDDDLLQVFRHEQALLQVLGEVRVANGDSAHALSYFLSKWRAFFGITAPQPGGTASPYQKGLIWSLLDDTAPVSATTWTAALFIPWFANLLAIGESARLRLFTAPLTAAAAPDLSLRLSIAGTIVGTFTYSAAEGAAGVCLELDVTRRADASGMGRYAVGFKGSAKATSLTLPSGLFSMVADLDNAIAVEAMWSAGGNAVVFREGTFEKL